MPRRAVQRELDRMAQLVLEDDEEGLLRRGGVEAVEQKRAVRQAEEKIAGHADLRPDRRAPARVDELACRAGQTRGERYGQLSIEARKKAAEALAAVDVVIEVVDARLPEASSNPMIPPSEKP